MILNPIIKKTQTGQYAHIIATAPTGSTVTCDGVVGTEVSGTWTFNIDTYGTHTVIGTKGSKTDTKTVTVTTNTDYSVTLVYTSTTYLYDEGDECTDLTGGYTVRKQHNATVTLNENTDNLNVVTTLTYGSYVYGGAGTVNAIDFTNYTYLKFNVVSYSGTTQIMLGSTETSDPTESYTQTVSQTGENTVTLSDTGLSSATVNLHGWGMNVTINKIWLE